MKKFIKKFFKSILIIIILILVTISVTYLFRNKLLEFVIEKKGSQLNGALVEVEGLNNPLFSLTLKLKKIQITNKNNYMKNSFEIKNVEFELMPEPLLAGKILINELNLGEVSLDTDRDVTGELPDKLKSKKKETEQNKEESLLVQNTKKYIEKTLEEKAKKAISFNDFDSEQFSDKLINEFNLEIEEEYKNAEIKVKDREKYWSELLKQRNYKNKIKTIEKELKNLDTDTSKLVSLFKNIKDYDSFKKFEKEFKRMEKEKKKVENLIRDGKTVVKNIEKDKKNFESDLKELNKIKETLAKTTESDLGKIKAVKNMNSDQLNSLTQNLFGKKASVIINKLLEAFYKTTSPFGDKETKASSKIIMNEKMPELPKFWIKETKLKVLYNNKFFQGEIKNITENQNKTEYPITINLTNKEKNVKTKIDSTIDYRGENKLKKLEVSVDGFNLKNESIGIAKIEKSNVQIKSIVELDKNDLKVNLNAELKDSKFSKQLDIKDEKTKKIVSDILKKLDYITLNIGYEDINSTKKYVLRSNIDKIISEELEKMYKKEIRKAEEKVKKEIEKQIIKYRSKLIKDVERIAKKNGIELSDNYKSALLNANNTKDIQKILNEELSKLDSEKKQKELEEKAEKELKKGLDKLFDF